MTDKKTNPTCPCKKKSCPRHGDCEACRKHHSESKHKRPVYCDKKNPFVNFAKVMNLPFPRLYAQRYLSATARIIPLNLSRRTLKATHQRLFHQERLNRISMLPLTAEKSLVAEELQATGEATPRATWYPFLSYPNIRVEA